MNHLSTSQSILTLLYFATTIRGLPVAHNGSAAALRTAQLVADAGLVAGTLPGIEVIGAGYDVFAGYASPLYVVSNVFDWTSAAKDDFTYNGKTYSKPSNVSAFSYTTSSLKSISGQDIQSYQQSLATSVTVEGSYNFFSGSLSAEFDSQSLTNSDYEFTRIQQAITTWSLRLTLDPTTRSLLTSSFRSELDGLNVGSADVCKSFFTRYGSHILTGAVIGGRATRTASTNKYTVDRSYDFSVTAQESFKFATSQIDSTQKAKYSNAVSSFSQNSDTSNFVVGGSADLGANVFSGDQSSTFNAWSKSAVDYPLLVDFTSDNALTPVWELCATDAAGQKVAAGLQNYFVTQWAPNASNRLTLRPDYMDAFTVVSGSNSDIGCTEGYTKLNFDLNASAGGKYIYLCYHKAQYNAVGNNKPAITDIAITYNNDPTPAGYTKINKDLNEGAGGAYIYLNYKTSAYDPNTAILDMRAFGGSSSNVAAPYGFTKVNSDLNAGAGGDYIYFAYAKRS